uniref:Ribosomal_S13_N domain-containing protein n=1 Tax=Bursaphelenchus xylophilus TaxID=6326 RepID=A0A1I7RT04_BURXY
MSPLADMDRIERYLSVGKIVTDRRSLESPIIVLQRLAAAGNLTLNRIVITKEVKLWRLDYCNVMKLSSVTHIGNKSTGKLWSIPHAATTLGTLDNRIDGASEDQ